MDVSTMCGSSDFIYDYCKTLQWDDMNKCDMEWLFHDDA